MENKLKIHHLMPNGCDCDLIVFKNSDSRFIHLDISEFYDDGEDVCGKTTYTNESAGIGLTKEMAIQLREHLDNLINLL